MKLEEQVLTIEQAKHLQELCLDMSDAALCWIVGEMSFQDTAVRHQSVVAMDSKPQQYAFVKEIIPTYTLQEVLDKLPKYIKDVPKDLYTLDVDLGDRALISYDGGCSVLRYYEIVEGNVLEAAYYMLCWVIEKGYLKEEKK